MKKSAKDADEATADDEPRARRRRQIVESACQLFAQRGYADCDMERVASHLGVAKGTLYLYFKSKEELFLACVDWGMQQMQAAIRAASDDVAEPFERIRQAIRAYLGFFAEHPEFVELLIQERAIFKSRKRPTYFEHRDAARARWRTFYQELIDQGRLRADLRVDDLLDTIGNLVYGTMFTNYFLGNRAPRDQHEQIASILFEGILSDRERRALK